VSTVRVDASLQTGLSRWLWLVKWLLAIPHYLILAFLVGGGWFVTVGHEDASALPVWRGGLIELLVLVAAVVLLVTGAYPRASRDGRARGPDAADLLGPSDRWPRAPRGR
jgi:hypothetical protein